MRGINKENKEEKYPPLILPAKLAKSKQGGWQPKVFIKTFGCQMNVRDSEVIYGLLGKEGFGFTDNADEADVILFNTCSVRQHAEDRVWSEVGRIAKMSPLDFAVKTRKIKTGGTPRPVKKIVGLVGCMAENYRDNAFKRMPGIDLVVGTNNIGDIPRLLKEIFTEGRGTKDERRILAVGKAKREEFIYQNAFKQDKKHSFVVISEGCDNFCSYCIVPYVRGRLRHRPPENILKEIETAIAQGAQSLTLLGQNVCAYASGLGFIRLLELVDKIKGLKEFSFVTSHPKDASVGLFQAMAHLGKLKKYLHLPFQSGSNRILELMNRGYSRQHYLNLVNNYRRIVSGGVLTTDIIVGFPGETEEDFKETLGLVRGVGFESAYIFKYSPRPNTLAEKLKDDVPLKEKQRRHQILLGLQKQISNELKHKK